MKEEVFEVKVQAPPRFYRYFPKVDAEDLALTIRDAVRAKSRGFIGPAPFKITVKWCDKLASANGEIGQYVPELFGGTPDELR